jgi:hypothetical protein
VINQDQANVVQASKNLTHRAPKLQNPKAGKPDTVTQVRNFSGLDTVNQPDNEFKGVKANSSGQRLEKENRSSGE